MGVLFKWAETEEKVLFSSLISCSSGQPKVLWEQEVVVDIMITKALNLYFVPLLRTVELEDEWHRELRCREVAAGNHFYSKIDIGFAEVLIGRRVKLQSLHTICLLILIGFITSW